MDELRRQNILKRLLADQRSGALKSRAEYEALFPGDEELVREEYPASRSGLPSTEWMVGQAGGGPSVEAPSFRDYEVRSEIGRGGQAVVYLATDTRLQRPVALKVLNGTSLANERSLARFRREALATSRLEHPNICPVYETGVDAAHAFIAMRWIDGQTLQQRMRRARSGETGSSYVRLDERTTVASGESTTPTAAERDRLVLLVEKVARALHAAHEAGVVHRDVKPGNIIIDRAGEPYVLDFGLAGDLDQEASALTLSGEVFGTPAYMAPEQVAADGRTVDRRVDVWALGVVLYESLTGRRPFAAPTRAELWRRIVEEDPPWPRQVDRGVPRDLDLVVRTALHKDPNRRYATAADFAEDLRRQREREPLRARTSSWWDRLQRWGQRNPVAALLLPAVTVILGVALLMTDDALRQAKERGAVLEQQEREQAAWAAVDQAFREFFDGAGDRGEAAFLRGIERESETEWCRAGLWLIAREPMPEVNAEVDVAAFVSGMQALLASQPGAAIPLFYRAMASSPRPRYAIHRGLLEAMRAAQHPQASAIAAAMAALWP